MVKSNSPQHRYPLEGTRFKVILGIVVSVAFVLGVFAYVYRPAWLR